MGTCTDIILGTIVTIFLAYLATDQIVVEARGGRFGGARFRGGYYRGGGGGGSGEYAWISGVVFGAIFLVCIIYILIQVCRKQIMRERMVKLRNTHKGKPVKSSKPAIVLCEDDSHSESEKITLERIPKNAVAPENNHPKKDLVSEKMTSPPPPYDPTYPAKQHTHTDPVGNVSPDGSVPPPAYYKAVEPQRRQQLGRSISDVTFQKQKQKTILY